MAKNQFLYGMRQWWKQKGIREQIFLSMLLITFLATAILGNTAYRAATNAIEENYREAYSSTLKNSSKVMDMNLKNMIDKSRDFLNNKDIKRILKEGKRNGSTQFPARDQTILRKAAAALTSTQPWVNSVTFMDLHNHLYQINNLNEGTYDFYLYYEENDFTGEAWSEETKAAMGKELFFGKNVLSAAQDDGFSMTKLLIDPATVKPMGYLVINISRKLLARSFVISGKSAQNCNYLIMDGTSVSDCVYYVGNAGERTAVISQYAGKTEKEDYVFSSVKNSLTGWRLVNAIARNTLSQESRMIRHSVFLCGILILMLCFIFARGISASITRPLKLLENVISLVGKGERHITEEFDYSEVGRIGRQFKEMVNTNLELSEHLMSVKLNEREAELLLLQSQINPHFLYNTLDSLYCVAIMHGDDQMAEMVMALSNNFKLALNNGNKYISVADSVRWVQEYMKLQNMRYNNRFELFVDIKREILPRKTISFILQPFIENAMYHGLEAKIGKGKISLLGWQEGNDMVFVIEDDGVGMDDLSVLEKGYGIRNVRERIRLNYGGKYGVAVESERGKGTRVTIRVPVE